MKVQPIDDNTARAQANAFRVWPKGIYDFEVVEAKDRLSTNGNDMIELIVSVMNAEGKTRKIYDYLVESENTAYKVRHFAQAVGMLAQYEKGTLNAHDLQGLTGRCSLRIKTQKDWPDKNVVDDYLPPGSALAAPPKAAAPKAKNDFPDDEIPF